jgi:hypothetical protein
MDTWIIWIVGCSIAYWIGQVVGKHIGTINLLHILASDPNKVKELIEKFKMIQEAENVEELDFPADAILLELEEVNGQVFAYDKLTGEFIAQGPNKYLAGLAAAARYPNKKFWHPDFKQSNQTA